MENEEFWFIHSDNLLLIQGMYNNETEAYENAATTRRLSLFKADSGDKKNIDTAAAVDKGGGEVGIPITGHNFIAGEYIHIQDTKNYDVEVVINSQTANEIVITAAFVAETFTGNETVWHGVLGATNITGAYIAASDGNYKWTIPASADFKDGSFYLGLITLAAGAYDFVVKEKRKAIFYPNERYE